jgi:hydrogenase 3 maturation protease
LLNDAIKKAFLASDGIYPVIVTIGNDLRNDDRIGLYIAEKLADIREKKFFLINAGMKPENIIDDVVSLNPVKVIFIDAANFGGAPGEIKIIQKEDLSEFILSTHVFPLGAIAKIIEDDTHAEVIFVCIQIKDASFGETISKEVLNSANAIIDYLLKL